MTSQKENEPLIYPEEWPGWADYKRKGGLLFASRQILLDILTESWNDYYRRKNTFINRLKTALKTSLIIYVREDDLNIWQEHEDFLRKHFLAVISTSLNLESFEIDVAPADAPTLSSASFYFFFKTSVERELSCHFYLNDEYISSLSLGIIKFLGERIQFEVRKKFIWNKGSFIYDVYQAYPALFYHDLILEDLRYLGWTLSFFSIKEKEQFEVFKIVPHGTLRGGTFLLSSHSIFNLEEIVEFYLSDDEKYRFRFIIAAPDFKLKKPSISDLELIYHLPFEKNSSKKLEVKVWLKNGPLKEDAFHLVAENVPLTLSFSQEHKIADDIFYQIIDLPEDFDLKRTYSWKPLGENIYGVSFEKNALKKNLIAAVQPKYNGKFILSYMKFEKKWDIKISLQQESLNHSFNLSTFFLYLKVNGVSSFKLSLFNFFENFLIFRYFPSHIKKKGIPEPQDWKDVQFFLEQNLKDSDPLLKEGCRVTDRKIFPDQPLATLQMSKFDEKTRFIPPDKISVFSKKDELWWNTHRFQVTRSLEFQNKRWNLLLWEPPTGRITFILQGQSSTFSVEIHNLDQETCRSHSNNIQTLWLSGDDKPRYLTDLNACTFPLALKKMTKLAKIELTPEGFRLFLPSQQILIYLDEVELAWESQENAQGYRFLRQNGWLLIENCLLRYKQHSQKSQNFRLTLYFEGYLLSHKGETQTIRIFNGNYRPHFLPQILLPFEKENELLINLLRQPSLYIQDLLELENPEKLQFGKIYRKDPLAFIFRKLIYNDEFHEKLFGDKRELLFLEIFSSAGRQNFEFIDYEGRLAYWRLRSHRLSEDDSHLIFPAEHERSVDEHIIPPHEIVIGLKSEFADFVLSPYFNFSSPLLFSFSLINKHLMLTSYVDSLYIVQLDKTLSDSLRLLHFLPITSKISLDFSKGNDIFILYNFVLFQLSKNVEEKDSKQTSYLFSVVGTFREKKDSLLIGGQTRKSALPTFDSSLNVSTEEHLFAIFYPDFQCKYQGKATLGIRYNEEDSLFEYFVRMVKDNAPSSSDESPLALLPQFAGIPSSSNSSSSSDSVIQYLENDLVEISYPDEQDFVDDSMVLSVNGLSLRYIRRFKEDVLPSSRDVPVFLQILKPQRFTFSLKDSQIITSSQKSLKRIKIGRLDPGIPDEKEPLESREELDLIVYEGEPTVGKIVLFGYSPRHFAELFYEDKKLYLKILPKYTVVLDDNELILNGKIIPISSQQQISLTINFLHYCRIVRKKKELTFTLEGYFLAYQGKPNKNKAVSFVHENRLGAIYLRSLPSKEEFFLKPSYYPAHFAQRNAKNIERLGASITLPQEEKVTLIDSQKFFNSMFSLFEERSFSQRLLWFSGESSNIAFVFRGESSSSASEDVSASTMERGAKLPKDEGSHFMGQMKAESSETLEEMELVKEDEGSHFMGQMKAESSETLEEMELVKEDERSHFMGLVQESLTKLKAKVLKKTSKEQERTKTVEELPPWRKQKRLRVGFFQKEALPEEPFYGFVCPEEGAQVDIIQKEEHYLLEEVIASVRLLRAGKLIDLTKQLAHEDILICGDAAFLINIEEGFLSLRRLWLGISENNIVQLRGMVGLESISYHDFIALTDLQERELALIYPFQDVHKIKRSKTNWPVISLKDSLVDKLDA